MDASPAPRRLNMDVCASTMFESAETIGDDAATLELVWRLQCARTHRRAGNNATISPTPRPSESSALCRRPAT
jgi:hypothetical protein